MVLIEACLTLVSLVLTYGEYQAMLVAAFLTSVVAFALSAGTSYALRRLKLRFSIALQFVIVQLFGIAFAALEMLSYKSFSLAGLFAFFVTATYVYAGLVLPLTLIYQKVMREYEVLPWHFTQYLMALLGSLVFWYFVIFWFRACSTLA
jgi:hypothetical protein